ncbi:MAG TPA: protein kinase [Planctomycetota bacterium]|nr:protein kinase [Planctomycetota bacterium]
MNPSDPPKFVSGKKGKKARLQEAESLAAEAMQAKDAAEKQAMDLHSGVQDLSRRTEELQNQVGELDAELKAARETARIADARAAEMAARAARAGDLEQEVAALRNQLEQVQTWSAELSAKADRAAAAEKVLRQELEKTQEQHVTVVRAKEEKVAALENRAKEGLKRLKDAHDSALREQAARATTSEREARDELKKLKELHELTIAEMAPMRTQVTELRAQVEKSDELRRDIDALSQQVGQSVGARDKLRRELDEVRSLLDHTRDELKKSQELRDESVRNSAALRIQITDLESKLKEALKEDPRLSGLQKELTGLREELKKAQDLRAASEREGGGFRTQVAGLQKDLTALREELKKAEGLRGASERDGAELRMQLAGVQKELSALREELKKAQDLRGASERDNLAFKARIAGLQKDLSGLRDELKRAQDLRGVADRDNAVLKVRIAEIDKRAREGSPEDPRVAALQKDLATMKARAEKSEAKSAEAARYFESMEKQLLEARDEADQAESLRGELEKMKEACREHEEGLDQLSETVMELQHQLDSAAEATPAPPTAPRPTAEYRVVLEAEAPKLPVSAVPPPLPPPPPAPKPEPMKIEIDVEPEAPLARPLPQPAPKPVVLAPSIAVPTASSAETTLRSNNTFGPNGPDGQPIYVLHEILPKDAKGVVYRATERSDGRAFAVRFLGGQAGEEQTRAFEKEVEKLISLPHPNILHVQGTGRRKNRLYVMMDLVDAPPLGAAKIQEIPRICAILRDAAAAVHYAHEEGIFHGDLNLETILVGKEEDQDMALVKDFGLAYMLETQTAGLRNPAFLPPEQVRVLKSPLSAAVDVYGLGATLFAALTGRAPFDGKDAAQVVKRVMIEEPPPVEKLRPDIPKAVGAVVRRAMAKERGVRFATAGEFSDALSKIC